MTLPRSHSQERRRPLASIFVFPVRRSCTRESLRSRIRRREQELKKYRRIEVNAFRRRVTVVSGEWPRYSFDAALARAADEVSLDDSDSCEPVAPDSPEGQLILVGAVRSLEQRLLPEARALISVDQNFLAPSNSNRNGFYLKLRSFCQSICPRVLRFARKEK